MDSLTFGTFLQQKRIAAKLTLRGMAKKLGISAAYLYDIEWGKRNPLGMDKLVQISHILHFTPEDENKLFNLAGKMRNEAPPDLLGYLVPREYVSAALRIARDLDADEADWQALVEELIRRKGKKARGYQSTVSDREEVETWQNL